MYIAEVHSYRSLQGVEGLREEVVTLCVNSAPLGKSFRGVRDFR